MKKIIFTTILLFTTIIITKAQNTELTTLRIGAFKYQMPIAEVKSLSEKPLKNGKLDYGENIKIAIYKGQEIKLSGLESYVDSVESELKIYSLSTKSALFKTKSGLGVGSTKEQLLDAYKNYPNFSVGQRWDSKTNKRSATETFFDLEDVDAGTHLQFIMENNVVVEVEVYMEEGC